ncbi:C1 family peptidase [Candidatus Palauibacter sp.]|uniref:C1 family peptidase n=1 Tax=Candidatus Palauibacter sp. TaxID=3101350 RepID=UPI003B59C435
MSAITVRQDLRGRFEPARDQGARATCLAFAMSDTHAAMRGGAWYALSCEYLFYQAKQRDGTPVDEGTTIPATRAALVHDGQPLETAWPYQAALPTDETKWKPPADVGVLYRRSSTPGTPAFNRIWDAVESNQPSVVVMTVSTAFYIPSSDGVVDSNEPENPVIRHAVVAVATGKRAGAKLLLVRNSWAESWGLAGHAWLSETYAAPRILAALRIS